MVWPTKKTRDTLTLLAFDILKQSEYFALFQVTEMRAKHWGSSWKLARTRALKWFKNLSNEKFLLGITHTVEHNYILPSKNTTTCFGPICGPSSGWDLTYRSVIQDVWGVLSGDWVDGWGRGRDFVVSIMGTKNPGCYKWIFSKSDVWLTVHRNSVWIRKTN